MASDLQLTNHFTRYYRRKKQMVQAGEWPIIPMQEALDGEEDLDDWIQNADWRDLFPVHIIDLGAYYVEMNGTTKGFTHEFDINPWYVHLTLFTKLPNIETLGEHFLVTFYKTKEITAPGSLPLSQKRVVEDGYMSHESYLIDHDATLFHADNDLEQNHRVEFILSLYEGSTERVSGFPNSRESIVNRLQHGVFKFTPEDILINKISPPDFVQKGKYISLGEYLKSINSRRPNEERFSIGPIPTRPYESRNLAPKGTDIEIIVFQNALFFYRDHSYIGPRNTETHNKLNDFVYGQVTIAQTIDRDVGSRSARSRAELYPDRQISDFQRERESRNLENTINSALDKPLDDGRQLDSDVKSYIGQFGGKKKRRYLKKNKKSKRKKSLKKKQRKTKRKGRR